MASGEEQRFDERRKTQLLRLHRSGRDRKLSRGTRPGRVELFCARGAPRSSPAAVLEPFYFYYLAFLAKIAFKAENGGWS